VKIKAISASLIAGLGIFVSLFIWGFSSPPGSAPDDDFHLPSIWCSHGKQEGKCDPEFKDDGFGKTPTPLSPSAICFAFKSDISAQCQSSQFDWNDQTLSGSRTNEKGRFPNGFYWTLNFLIGDNTLLSAMTMRIFNSLLATILVISTIALSPRKIKKALIGSWIAVVVPLGLFTISSTNPSSWTVIGIGTYWASLYSFLLEKNKIKNILLASLVFTSAMISIQSRSEASPYILLSTLIVFVLLLDFEKIRKLILKILFIAFINLIAIYEFLTTPSTLGWSTGLPGGDENRSLKAVWFYNITEWPTFISGSIGGWPLGWLDVPVPSITYFMCLLVFAGLILSGLNDLSKRKALALSFIFAALLILPLRILALGKNFVGENVQPRYFLPLIFLFVGISLISTNKSEEFWLSRTQIFVIILASSIANFFALHFVLRRFITGTDVVDWNLNRNIEWWWSFMPSPLVSWFIGSIAFSIAITIGLWQMRDKSKVLN
jgi:hypothetical protein